MSKQSSKSDKKKKGLPKKKHKECSVEGCTGTAADSGTCSTKHKGYNICREEGCTNRSQKGGVCIQHGAKPKICTHEGCTNQVKNNGVCVKHGAVVKTCKHEGCTNKSVKEGVCVRHGAKVKTCIHEACTNNARKGGVCTKHGAKQTLCSIETCTNNAKKGGLCIRHGAKITLCSVETCTRSMQKGDLCGPHYKLKNNNNNNDDKSDNGKKRGVTKSPSTSTPVANNTPRNNNNNTGRVSSKKRVVTKTPATASTSSIRKGVGNETPHGTAAAKKSALPTFPATTPRDKKKAGSVVVAPIEPKEIDESDSKDDDSKDDDCAVLMDSLPKHDWDTICQTLDAREGYDRIRIQLTNDGNKEGGIECFNPDNSQSDDLTVYTVLPGSIAATTEIREGDIVVPVEIDGNISTAKNTRDWLVYKLNELPITIDVYRPSFFGSSGSLNDKKLFAGRLITKMKNTYPQLIKTNTLHSSQGKFMDPDGNDSVGACVVISILICERHVDVAYSNRIDGITNNEIKKILECKDTGAPKYAPLIREHHSLHTSSDIAVDEAYNYLVNNKIVKGTCRNITQDMSVGNILNRQHVLEHIVEPLYNNGESGRVGIFLKGHMITILKGRRYCSFIDTQTSLDIETVTYPDANRVRFNYSSTAVPLLLDYILKKLCVYDNPDTYDHEEWVHDDMNADDSRTFWSYVFKPDKSASDSTDEEDDDSDEKNRGDEAEQQKAGNNVTGKRKRSKPKRYQDSSDEDEMEPPPVRKSGSRSRKRKVFSHGEDKDEMEPPPPPPPPKKKNRVVDSHSDMCYLCNEPEGLTHCESERCYNSYHPDCVDSDGSNNLLEQCPQCRRQPSIEQIEEIVDKVMSKKNREEAHVFAAVREECGVDLTYSTLKAVNNRLHSWLGRALSKPVAKCIASDDGDKVEIVRVYPSANDCWNKNDLDVSVVAMKTHLDKGGYSYGDSLYVWHRNYSHVPRLSKDHKMARLNGTEGRIQRLVIDGRTVKEDKEYTDVADCRAKNEHIPETRFDANLVNGGQIIEDDETTYFFRYKFAHPGVPLVLDDETILAKRDGIESTVIKQRLPGVRSEKDGRVTYSFETVELGTEEQFLKQVHCNSYQGSNRLAGHHSKATRKELLQGGYVKKEGDDYWFVSYKYKFKTGYLDWRLISNIMLSDVEKLDKYWAFRRSKDQKLVCKQSRKESRELARQVKNTQTILSDIVKGNESNWHGSTVSPKKMIRSDEEKEAHEIYIKPANTFSQQERNLLDIKPNNSHEDVFYTRSFRQSLRFIQNDKTRYDPYSSIYMYELYDSIGHPSGLSLGGRWQTPGLKGVYKTSNEVPVKRVIKVKLGRYGNVNDSDCHITVIRDDGEMDTKLHEELRVKALKPHSDHFIEEAYYNLDGADSDDESTGDEKAFKEQSEQQREQTEQTEQIRINKERATADQISAITRKIIEKTKDITPPSESPRRHYKHLVLTLSDLDDTLLLLRNEKGRRKLRKAFQIAQREWKENNVGQVDVNEDDLAQFQLMAGLGYYPIYERRCLSMSFNTDGQNDDEEEEEIAAQPTAV